jgi:hypothetical protein
LACIATLWLAGIFYWGAEDLWHGVTYTVNYVPLTGSLLDFGESFWTSDVVKEEFPV